MFLSLFGIRLESTSIDLNLNNVDQNIFYNNESYQLVIIDNNVNKRKLQRIVLDEKLYFYRVSAFVVKNGINLPQRWREEIDPEWLKADIAWVIIGTTGRVHGGGLGSPNSAVIADLLERMGSANLMRDLETFLGTHPYHVESRLAALRGYIQRATTLTRRLIPDVGRLSPSDDDFLWLPVIRHAEHLLMGQVHPMQLVDIFWSLPDEEIEKKSTYIKMLYKKIHPILVNYIRVNYTNIEIFYFLMRIDRIIDRSGALDALQSVPVVLTPLHFVDFPSNLSEHLLSGAKRGGDYHQVLPILANLWTQRKAGLVGGIPRIDSEDAPPNQYDQWRRTNQLEQKRLTEAWYESLRPLLVALMKCGNGEVEALNLLSDLDERWKAVPLYTWVRELANDMGRKDLVPIWLAGVTPLRRVPLTRVNLSPSYEMFVEGTQKEEASKLCFWLAVRGYRSPS